MLLFSFGNCLFRAWFTCSHVLPFLLGFVTRNSPGPMFRLFKIAIIIRICMLSISISTCTCKDGRDCCKITPLIYRIFCSKGWMLSLIISLDRPMLQHTSHWCAWYVLQAAAETWHLCVAAHQGRRALLLHVYTARQLGTAGDPCTVSPTASAASCLVRHEVNSSRSCVQSRILL